LGWTYFWGLVPNLVGIATLLAVLPALDTLAARPTWKNAAYGCLGMLALYFAHEAMMVAACPIVVFFAFCQPFRIRDMLVRFIPPAFACAIFYGEMRWQASFITPTVRSVPTTYLSFHHKITTIPGALFGGHEPELQLTFFGLCVFAMLVLVVLRVKH